MEGRRVKRSRYERKVAGVCGGLGEYFGIDPTLLRIFFAVTALFGGQGLILYIILWVVIPEE